MTTANPADAVREALERIRTELLHSPDGGLIDFTAITDHIAALTARVVELECEVCDAEAKAEAHARDAGRWKWMWDQDASLLAKYGVGGRCDGYYVITGDIHNGAKIHDVKPTELEAIDAAMEQNP